MTPDARVEATGVDLWGARTFLERARELLADGAKAENSAASRLILLHTATVAACDAVLSASGRRFVGSDGGHLLRLREAEELLRGDHRRLFEGLEASRGSRNAASYAAAFVPADDVESSQIAVAELVAVVAAHLDARSPDWLVDE
jgi:hypothetical protein